MLQVFVDGTEINQSDIVKISSPADEKLKFEFSSLISAKISVELNNSDRSKYDDTYEGAFFNLLSWYNKTLRIVDTTYNMITWEGRIKNLKRDDGKKRLTIESTNYIKDIIDKDCIISAGSLSNITPSEIIYSILTDVVSIPAAAINITSFDNAKAVQAANSGYIIVNYDAESSTQCSSVVNEILRITSSYLYTINNIIYYHQFSPYSGAQNLLIDESMIVAASFSDEYNSENIFNDFNVAYKSSDTVVAYATPATTPTYITVSKAKFGTHSFNVPDEDQDSTTPGDFNILLKSLTSARYYGELVRQSNHYMKKICKFNILKSVSGIYLNTFIDMDYSNLVREPMRITGRKIAEKYVTITAEFLNFPYDQVERDDIRPDPVKLVSVKHFVDSQVEMQWTMSPDPGFYQYIVEFSTSPVDFQNEYSAEGYSPVLVQDPDIINGLCRFRLSNFEDTAKYYFRVKVQDTAGNIGLPSNVVTLNVNYLTKPAVNACFYHCSGDIVTGLAFADGIGSLSGDIAVSGEYTTYDDFNYGADYYEYAGMYRSGVLCNTEGFHSVVLITNQPTDYYDVAMRSYDTVTASYGEWINLTGIEVSGEYGYIAEPDNVPDYLQFRVCFDVPNLYDPFSIHIYSINQGY